MDYTISFNNLVYKHIKSDKIKPNEFSSHTHNKYEILYLLSGDVDCVIGNMRSSLKTGEMVIIPSLYAHHIEVTGQNPYERIVLNFDKSGATDDVLKKVFSAPKIIDTDKFPYIADIFKRFKAYNNLFEDNERQTLFFSILTELIYIIYNTLSIQSAAVTFDGYSNTAHKTLKYIDSHLYDINDIDDICKNLFISKAYLHKMFLNSLGISPMKYIKTKRLIAAREMIRLGEKPTNVASKICYNDYTTFFRAYKNYFGYSPASTQTNSRK